MVPFGGLSAGDLEGGLPYWLAESGVINSLEVERVVDMEVKDGRRSGTECAVVLTSMSEDGASRRQPIQV